MAAWGKPRHYPRHPDTASWPYHRAAFSPTAAAAQGISFLLIYHLNQHQYPAVNSKVEIIFDVADLFLAQLIPGTVARDVLLLLDSGRHRHRSR